MKDLIAYCGLNCGTCPIHLATQEQDRSKQHVMRIEITYTCSQMYKMDLRPGDINDCYGCRSDIKKLFSGCAECEIRKCAIGRNLFSCALCDDYACDTLIKHFGIDPEARARLDAIRKIS